MTDDRMTGYEGFSLLSILLFTKILYTSVVSLCSRCQSAAWWVTLISALICAGMLALQLWLLRRYEGKEFHEILCFALGSFVGRLLCGLLGLYFLFYAAVNLREACGLIRSYNYPKTPLAVLTISVLLVSVYLGRKSIGSLGRLSALCLPGVLLGIGAILLFNWNNYDPHLLAPYFGNGFWQSVGVGVTRSSAYGEVLLLSVFAASFPNQKMRRRTGMGALGLGAGIIFLVMLCYCMTFPYTVSAQALSGMLRLAKQVAVSEMLQRIEVVFLLVMVVCSAILLAVSFHAAGKLLCVCFALQEPAFLTGGCAAAVFYVSQYAQSANQFIETCVMMIREMGGIVLYGLPLAALLVSFLHRKSKEVAP